MFKVGDKVRVIRAEGGFDGPPFREGEVLTVASNQVTAYIAVVGYGRGWLANRFELVEWSTTPACKFEVGKEYKTRDGRSAKVLAIYPKQFHHNIIGAVYNSANEWVECSWFLGGYVHDEDESDWDLVLPKTTVYLNSWKGVGGGVNNYVHNSEKVAKAQVDRLSSNFVAETWLARAKPIKLEG